MATVGEWLGAGAAGKCSMCFLMETKMEVGFWEIFYRWVLCFRSVLLGLVDLYSWINGFCPLNTSGLCSGFWPSPKDKNIVNKTFFFFFFHSLISIIGIHKVMYKQMWYVVWLLNVSHHSSYFISLKMWDVWYNIILILTYQFIQKFCNIILLHKRCLNLW